MSGMDSKQHYAVLVLPPSKLVVEGLQIATHLENKLTFILKLSDKITQMISQPQEQLNHLFSLLH
jgi:hypothetical protein